MLSRTEWRQVCSSTAVLLIWCWSIQLPTFAQSSRPPALSAPNAASSDTSNYVLGAGDELALSVFGYDEYTGEKVILPDGTISLPLLGSVPAADRTPDQLAQELTTRLQSLLVNPVVTVTLINLRPVVVTVSGAVQRPGPIQLRPPNEADLTDETVTSPTVITALTQAGGVTPNADVRQVTLRRYDPSGTAEPIVINLWDALWSDSIPQNLVLRDGDALYIPELPAGETLDQHLIARSSLSPATVRVRVVGEVNNPGEIQVPPNSSLSSAVAIAGGPTDDARLNRVAFVRMNETGQIERQTIDLSNLTDSYQVQEGDVLIVPKKDSSSFLDMAGRATSPLGLLLNLFLGL